VADQIHQKLTSFKTLDFSSGRRMGRLALNRFCQRVEFDHLQGCIRNEKRPFGPTVRVESRHLGSRESLLHLLELVLDGSRGGSNQQKI
jgi:hypothetical protein